MPTLRRCYKYVLIATFPIASSAAAQVPDFFVDSAATSGKDDGLSWANAFLTLEQALVVAGEDDIIWVAVGDGS